MEIKDLAGLSEPLSKLIETVGRGLGTLTRAYFIKKDAKAQADAIGQITDSIFDAREKGISVTYESGKVTIAPDPNWQGADKQLVERTASRVEYQALNQQANIEQITAYAAEEVAGMDSVSAEPVDEDWLTNYFDLAKNVSSERLQEIWGKILAGEIQQPGSFSLRTLEVLKNLSSDEAQLFAKIAPHALEGLSAALGWFVYAGQDMTLLLPLPLSRNELLLLEEAGLVFAEVRDLSRNLSDHSPMFKFLLGTVYFEIDVPSDYPYLFPALTLTRSGGELSRLIEKSADDEYISSIKEYVRWHQLNGRIGRVLNRRGNEIEYELEEELRYTP